MGRKIEENSTLVSTTEYMNSRSKRVFSVAEARAIRDAIPKERAARKKEALIINSRTIEGKKHLNTRIADIASKISQTAISFSDVRLYKQCWADEYSDRTGKCSWGFPHVRRRLGYNEVTGEEIDDL